ncbi:DUF418 domain-containing protein [Asanoa sp. NPDC050611]|uniref:DUF418 domain-containing protein n=1 Tax=Asanoa sp. NPDC050611 TaxID=3157098 RepID=UPI0033F76C12
MTNHSVSSAAAPARPGTAARRILDVDALRGFALFGILVVNIAFFATAYPWHGVDDPAFSSGVDDAVRWFVALAFEMKFYLLFSFLFGYSFTLQMDSAARAGASFRARMLRRLATLFVLGAAHAVLFFHGDILTTYAVLGLVLLAMRRVGPRTAMITAVVLTVVVAAFIALASLGGLGPSTDTAAALAGGQRSTAALEGSPATVIAEHLRSMPQMLSALASVQAPAALAAFLVGLAAGKRRVLAEAHRHRRALRTVQLVGYPVGLAGAAVFASTGGTTGLNMVAVALTVVTGPLLAAAYVATLLRFFGTPTGHRVAGALAPAGRMALTNYLAQSVVCAVIFTGWGFGLIGDVSPPAAVGIAVAVFAAQAVFSARWLAGHRYGPVEWVLRAATNARRPQWRRTA